MNEVGYRGKAERGLPAVRIGCRCQAAAIVLFLMVLPLGAQEIEKTPEPPPVELPEQITTLADLEKAYSQLKGRNTPAGRLTTLRLEGNTWQNDAEYDFVVLKRAPRFLRATLSVGDFEATYGYDGTTAWEKIALNGKVSIRSLSAPEATQLRREALFESPLLDFAKKDSKCRFLGESQVEGTRVYGVEVIFADGSRSHLFFDAETLLERKVVAWTKVEGPPPLETFFYEYKRVAGVPIPHVVETRVGGRVVSRSRVTEASCNIGLFTQLFRKPQSANE